MQITNVYSAHRANDKVMGALRKMYDQVGYKSFWIFAAITYGRHKRIAGYFLKIFSRVENYKIACISVTLFRS